MKDIVHYIIPTIHPLSTQSLLFLRYCELLLVSVCYTCVVVPSANGKIDDTTQKTTYVDVQENSLEGIALLLSKPFVVSPLKGFLDFTFRKARSLIAETVGMGNVLNPNVCLS